MKIALTGSHGTGKSTLSEYLKAQVEKRGLSAEITSEAPRHICDLVGDNEYFRRGKNSLLKQSLISIGQLALERQCLDSIDVQICDRTLMDHLAYSLNLFEDEIREDDFLEVYEHFISMHCRSYDKIFYLPIEFKPVDDGVREADEAFQAEIDRLLVSLFKKHGMELETVTGSVEERCEQVLRSIGTLVH
jgi:thymidylate kinase